MSDVRLVRGEVSKLAPGDLLDGPGWHILCCPGCGKNVSLRHTVELHPDGTVSLWAAAGIGSTPRSFVCPLCGYHRTIDHGRAS